MLSDSDGERELREYEDPPGTSSDSWVAPRRLNSPPALAVAPGPRIDQFNAHKNSKVYIGDRFIKVSKTVHHTEVVKAQFGGFELEAGVGRAKNRTGKIHNRRLRCSVAVFVCWALLVATGLALYLMWRFVLVKWPARLDLDIMEPWYLRRGDWQAMPSYRPLELLDLPVRYAIVGHSARPWCEDRYNCTKEVLKIQSLHQRIGWDDIAPNFLFAGNGLVFEGCGANIVGAMVRSWNTISVSFMFLGDYRIDHDSPTPEQLQHLALVLEALVRAGVLHQEYKLLGHCQVTPRKSTPGQVLLDELKSFKHWDNVNVTLCNASKNDV